MKRTLLLLVFGILLTLPSPVVARLMSPPRPMDRDLVTQSEVICVASTISISEGLKFPWPIGSGSYRCVAQMKVERCLKGSTNQEIRVKYRRGSGLSPFANYTNNSTTDDTGYMEAVPAAGRCLLFLKALGGDTYELTDPQKPLLSLTGTPPVSPRRLDLEGVGEELLHSAADPSPSIAQPAIQALITLHLRNEEITAGLRAIQFGPAAAARIRPDYPDIRRVALEARVQFGCLNLPQEFEEGVYSPEELQFISGHLGYSKYVALIPFLTACLASQHPQIRLGAIKSWNICPSLKWSPSSGAAWITPTRKSAIRQSPAPADHTSATCQIGRSEKSSTKTPNVTYRSGESGANVATNS